MGRPFNKKAQIHKPGDLLKAKSVQHRAGCTDREAKEAFKSFPLFTLFLRPLVLRRVMMPTKATASNYDFDQYGNLVPFPFDKILRYTKKDSTPFPFSEKAPQKWAFGVDPQKIQQVQARDQLLTSFGKTSLQERYLLPGENFQNLFARVAGAFGDNIAHAQRLYSYMSKLWFMPATPILSNGGTTRGLPISCFLNQVEDSLEGIMQNYTENLWLSAKGGGIGSYWGKVRSLGEPIGLCGETSGIIPFIKVTDAFSLAISQGSLRRGSAAVYLDIHHPEIEEFVDLRKPTGDFNRKALNLHHGILITDAFMEAVEKGETFTLKSPKTGEMIRTIEARTLWQKILETRLQTGEPYIIYIDNVNQQRPPLLKKLGLQIHMSNLCSEIFLPTGPDHLGHSRTAVCCLSSLNLEKWDEWHTESLFIEDVMRFLDNVLETYIQTAPAEMKQAVYSATRERSVGLGVMGLHGFFMQKGIPFGSVLAKGWNKKIFKHIKSHADQASYLLSLERGPCLDAAEEGMNTRFSHKLAIAPTASISIICGGTTAGIEPLPSNIYTHKTLSGSTTVKNPHLEKLLTQKGYNTPDIWLSILEHQGSVQHLSFLTDTEKEVFKTAFEIDQRWLIELAGDRTPFICQGQSLNLFLRPDIHKWDLMMLHRQAWTQGVKSLYYVRSYSKQRAQFLGQSKSAKTLDESEPSVITPYTDCLSCQ